MSRETRSQDDWQTSHQFVHSVIDYNSLEKHNVFSSYLNMDSSNNVTKDNVGDVKEKYKEKEKYSQLIKISYSCAQMTQKRTSSGTSSRGRSIIRSPGTLLKQRPRWLVIYSMVN